MSHTIPTEALAAQINALAPDDRKRLSAFPAHASGGRMNRLVPSRLESLLEEPLGIPVLHDERLPEPLTSFQGRILPVAQLAQLAQRATAAAE